MGDRLGHRHGQAAAGSKSGGMQSAVCWTQPAICTLPSAAPFSCLAWLSGSGAVPSAQLLLVDCIFVAVAQRRMDETLDALRSTYDTVAEFRDG